jgi:arylsulfatase A-like enzyme
MMSEAEQPQLNRRDFMGRMAVGAAVAGIAPATSGGADMTQRRPNILFLMADQMHGRVLDPDHVCKTPNFDRLAARGVRFNRAYTPNPVCSPARASLMTGLLPHNHRVTQVTHCTFDDEANLRTELPHWAQRLTAAGYDTAYFGKWHIERTNDLTQFGWRVNGEASQPLYQAAKAEGRGDDTLSYPLTHSKDVALPEGYPARPLYGVTEQPLEQRMLGETCGLAERYLDGALQGSDPWCCFVSVIEPHDPFIAHKDYFEQYDVNSIPVPPNWDDDLANKPGLYRKSAEAFRDLSQQDKQTAAACYYASITEIDAAYGKLIDRVEKAGQLDNTIVVLTSDHGEYLGAHQMYTKNVGAYEEAYEIPMVLSGPGVAAGALSGARMGLHDLCPTLLELAGLDPIDVPDSQSLARVLADPVGASKDFTQGYAEYSGNRYWFSQRVLWDGAWKFVWNGFDYDELYNLEEDPYELRNLIHNPAYQEEVKRLMGLAWAKVRETGDTPLENSSYFSLRLAPYGPDV